MNSTSGGVAYRRAVVITGEQLQKVFEFIPLAAVIFPSLQAIFLLSHNKILHCLFPKSLLPYIVRFLCVCVCFFYYSSWHFRERKIEAWNLFSSKFFVILFKGTNANSWHKKKKFMRFNWYNSFDNGIFQMPFSRWKIYKDAAWNEQSLRLADYGPNYSFLLNFRMLYTTRFVQTLHEFWIVLVDKWEQ